MTTKTKIVKENIRKGFVIKVNGKNKLNLDSIYWLFMIPILLPLMLWVSSLIIQGAGWTKGMFIIVFPMLVGSFVVSSKEKVKVLIMGIFTYVIGWIIFSQVQGVLI